MSKIVARMEKMKTGNLEGIQRHNQRETQNHSNKEIDTERSCLNYDLVNQESINYRERIHEIINEQRVSKRSVRKDAVLVDEWIITSDKNFFETRDSKKFFEDSLAYFSDRCGSQNIAYATVHLDETTPHMHLGIVPMYENRLSSKQMFSRQSLKQIQDELPCYLQERGHKIERGIKGSEQKHLTVEEYKENQQAIKHMNQVLEEKKNELTLINQQVISQQQVLTTELANSWAVDWIQTKEVMDGFEMTYHLTDTTTQQIKTVDVDEETPKKFKLNFYEIIDLFKEKYKQLKEYITLKWNKLTYKSTEIDNMMNILSERENALKLKLGLLETKVTTQTEKSQKLNDLLSLKFDYLTQLAKESEVSVNLPSYAKTSKLHKNMLLIPKEKWESKHVATDTIKNVLALQNDFKKLETTIYKQAETSINSWESKMKQTQLEQKISSLMVENRSLSSVIITLLDSGELTTSRLEQIVQPQSKQRQKTHDRDLDHGMSL